MPRTLLTSSWLKSRSLVQRKQNLNPLMHSNQIQRRTMKLSLRETLKVMKSTKSCKKIHSQSKRLQPKSTTIQSLIFHKVRDYPKAKITHYNISLQKNQNRSHSLSTSQRLMLKTHKKKIKDKTSLSRCQLNCQLQPSQKVTPKNLTCFLISLRRKHLKKMEMPHSMKMRNI